MLVIFQDGHELSINLSSPPLFNIHKWLHFSIFECKLDQLLVSEFFKFGLIRHTEYKYLEIN